MILSSRAKSILFSSLFFKSLKKSTSYPQHSTVSLLHSYLYIPQKQAQWCLYSHLHRFPSFSFSSILGLVQFVQQPRYPPQRFQVNQPFRLEIPLLRSLEMEYYYFNCNPYAYKMIRLSKKDFGSYCLNEKMMGNWNILKEQKNDSKLKGVSSTQEEIHFEDDTEEQILEERPIPVGSLQQDSLTGYWQPIRKKTSKKTVQINTQQQIDKICDRRFFKLDRVVVPPEHYEQWTVQSQIVKKIFQDRAKRQTKVILSEQKPMLVEFVDFGVQKLGLRRLEMINLAGISQSSYKRWKRNPA